jgi:hypothetical protein
LATEGGLNLAAFSPNGNLLGARDQQLNLHIWRAPSLAEIEAAERERASLQVTTAAE